MRARTAVAVALMMWATAVSSSEPTNIKAHAAITLAEALELSGASAPTLEAANAGQRAATAQRQLAGLRPNPSLVAESGNVVGSGIYQGTQSAETTVGMSLPVELGGKRGR